MTVFGVVCAILAVAIACLIPFLPKIAENWQSRGRAAGRSGARGRRPRRALQDLWGIEDVRDGIITLEGGRHRAVMRVSVPVNVGLMSEEEQTAVEDALIGFCMGITFPVQFVKVTDAVDTRRHVGDLAARALGDPSEVRRAYANSLCAYLEAVQDTESVLTQEAFVVVAGESADRAAAAQELSHRCGLLSAGLAKAGVRVERLSSGEILDLLHRQLNRGRRVRPSEAVAAGGIDLCVTGKGVPLGAVPAKEAE